MQTHRNVKLLQGNFVITITCFSKFTYHSETRNRCPPIFSLRFFPISNYLLFLLILALAVAASVAVEDATLGDSCNKFFLWPQQTDPGVDTYIDGIDER